MNVASASRTVVATGLKFTHRAALAKEFSRPAINPRGAVLREVLLRRLSAKRGPVLTASLTPPAARRPPLLRKCLGRRHFSGHNPLRMRYFEDEGAVMGLPLCRRARHPCKQPGDYAVDCPRQRLTRTHANKRAATTSSLLRLKSVSTLSGSVHPPSKDPHCRGVAPAYGPSRPL